MAELTMRELRKRLSEIVQSVEEDHTRYVITRYGRPIATLAPYDGAPAMIGEPSAWDQLAALSEQLAREWSASQNSTQILSEMR